MRAWKLDKVKKCRCKFLFTVFQPPKPRNHYTHERVVVRRAPTINCYCKLAINSLRLLVSFSTPFNSIFGTYLQFLGQLLFRLCIKLLHISCHSFLTGNVMLRTTFFLKPAETSIADYTKWTRRFCDPPGCHNATIGLRIYTCLQRVKRNTG